MGLHCLGEVAKAVDPSEVDNLGRQVVEANTDPEMEKVTPGPYASLSTVTT